MTPDLLPLEGGRKRKKKCEKITNGMIILIGILFQQKITENTHNLSVKSMRFFFFYPSFSSRCRFWAVHLLTHATNCILYSILIVLILIVYGRGAQGVPFFV